MVEPHNPRSIRWRAQALSRAAERTVARRRAWSAILLVLTLAYLGAELAFQADLLDSAGVPARVDGLAAWGRLLTACALVLAVWSSFVLPIAQHRWALLVPMLVFSALASGYLSTAAEQWLMERVVDRSTGAQRQDAVRLQRWADAVRHGDAGGVGVDASQLGRPAGRALLLLLPAFALDDARLARGADARGPSAPQPRAPAASFEDDGANEGVGRAAVRAVVLPAMRLGLSLFGLAVQLVLAAGHAAALAAPRAAHRTLLVGATIGSLLLLLPLFLPNPVSRSEGFERLRRLTTERMNAPVAHLAGWAVQAVPYLYPAGDAVRREAGIDLQVAPAEACTASALGDWLRRVGLGC